MDTSKNIIQNKKQDTIHISEASLKPCPNSIPPSSLEVITFLQIRLLLSIIQMDFYSMFPFMSDSKMIVISDYVVAGGCHLLPFISISIVRILHSLFIHYILFVNNFVVSSLGSFQIMLLQTFLNMSSGAQT